MSIPEQLLVFDFKYYFIFTLCQHQLCYPSAFCAIHNCMSTIKESDIFLEHENITLYLLGTEVLQTVLDVIREPLPHGHGILLEDVKGQICVLPLHICMHIVTTVKQI